MMNTTSLECDMTQQDKRSPLLTHSVTQQFGYLAIPIILGMVINGLYSFIDALFISQGIGTQAMGAVSAVFPIQMFLLSISTMLGSGMASQVSRYLGAQRQSDADTVFSASFMLAFVLGSILSTIIFINLDSIFMMLAVPEVLHVDAKSYITPIILFWAVGFMCNQLTEGFRASGNPKAMMQVLSVASILNIVLDALFIFVFEWGVSGAAWATIAAISIALAIALFLQNKGASKVNFNIKKLLSPIKIYIKMMSLGFPVLMSHGGFSVILAATVYSISTVFPDASESLITAHGILMRCFMFLFLPIIGMMVALQTLAGFNYGAGEYRRVRAAYIVAVTISSVWGAIVIALLCFNADWLIGFFTEDRLVIELGEDIARLCFSGFIAIGFCMMSSGLFQGMGKAIPATMLDAARTYVLLLPFMYLFPHALGADSLWFAFPSADMIGGIVALIYSFYHLNFLVKKYDFLKS